MFMHFIFYLNFIFLQAFLFAAFFLSFIFEVGGGIGCRTILRLSKEFLGNLGFLFFIPYFKPFPFDAQDGALVKDW